MTGLPLEYLKNGSFRNQNYRILSDTFQDFFIQNFFRQFQNKDKKNITFSYIFTKYSKKLDLNHALVFKITAPFDKIGLLVEPRNKNILYSVYIFEKEKNSEYCLTPVGSESVFSSKAGIEYLIGWAPEAVRRTLYHYSELLLSLNKISGGGVTTYFKGFTLKLKHKTLKLL